MTGDPVPKFTFRSRSRPNTLLSFACAIDSTSTLDNTAIMSVPTLAPQIMKRPWLMRWMKPLSKWYFNNAGYRKLGLRYADTFRQAPRAKKMGLVASTNLRKSLTDMWDV